MKILLASALFPPDTAEQAIYTKELARRLGEQHQITVITYGSIPEAVPGVRISTISKQQSVVARLISYTLHLWKETHTADVLLFENGPSIEMPIAIVRLFKKHKTLFHESDERAKDRIRHSFLLRTIESFVTRNAQKISSSPLPRPEVLPLELYPTTEMEAYEQSWNNHLTEITHAIHGT